LHKLTEFSIRTHLGRTSWWKRLTYFLDAPEQRVIKKVNQMESKQSTIKEQELIDPENIKELDRKKMLDFMKGRAEVIVYDIIQNSGVNSLRVYSLLFEEVQRGHVTVIKEGSMGSPEIVKLIVE